MYKVRVLFNYQCYSIALINISVARVIFLRMPAVDWILLRGLNGSVAE